MAVRKEAAAGPPLYFLGAVRRPRRRNYWNGHSTSPRYVHTAEIHVIDWSFLGLHPAAVAPLAEVTRFEIVVEPGVYVLAAASGISYPYPSGFSPIFYIGVTNRLRRRLYSHKRRLDAALAPQKTHRLRPRYEYAAAHGCLVAAFPMDHGDKDTCLAAEADATALFVAQYGAPPIANGTASVETVLRRQVQAPPALLTARDWRIREGT